MLPSRILADDAHRALRATCDDHRARAAVPQKPPILRIAKKSNLALAGLVDRRDSMNNRIAVANDLSSNVPGELIERFTERHLFFHPAVKSLDNFARDVDPLIAVKDLRAL